MNIRTVAMMSIGFLLLLSATMFVEFIEGSDGLYDGGGIALR